MTSNVLRGLFFPRLPGRKKRQRRVKCREGALAHLTAELSLLVAQRVHHSVFYFRREANVFDLHQSQPGQLPDRE